MHALQRLWHMVTIALAVAVLATPVVACNLIAISTGPAPVAAQEHHHHWHEASGAAAADTPGNSAREDDEGDGADHSSTLAAAWTAIIPGIPPLALPLRAEVLRFVLPASEPFHLSLPPPIRPPRLG